MPMTHVTQERLVDLMKRAEKELDRLGSGVVESATPEQHDKLALALWEFLCEAEHIGK